MSINVAAHAIVNVGEPLVVESSSPKAAFGVVFEDDGDTGYFYGVDLSRKPQPILDALLIYDVAQVLDRDVSSTIQIAWSSDGLSAALLVNSAPHAIFDFAAIAAIVVWSPRLLVRAGRSMTTLGMKMLGFVCNRRPNPSLNRTPAGGLSPARRSPVSLLH